MTIRFISDSLTVFATSDGADVCYQTCALQFRPIRTPEQIEEERRDRVIDAMKTYYYGSTTSCHFTCIYDAIRAGKIKGVKIDG